MGIISYVNEEIQVIRERDPAIKSNMEVSCIQFQSNSSLQNRT